jgi:hypothetical protein
LPPARTERAAHEARAVELHLVAGHGEFGTRAFIASAW